MKFGLKGIPSTPTLIGGILLLSLGFIVGIYSGGKNATLGATLIGGLLGVSGGLFANFFSFLNEREKWKNQTEADEKKRMREEEIANSKRLEDIYTNTLYHLSIIYDEEQKRYDNGEENPPLSQREIDAKAEATKWANLLLFNLPEDITHESIDSFKSSVSFNRYDMSMRGDVISIAKIDPRVKVSGRVPSSGVTDLKTFTFEIDDDFIKSKLIEGKVIPNNKSVVLRLRNLTPLQREVLTSKYYRRESGLPTEMALYVPTYNARSRKIEEAIWKAKFWHDTTGLSSRVGELAFMQAWETDYKDALAEAERQRTAS